MPLYKRSKAYEGKEAVESWLAEVNVPGLKTTEDLITFDLDHQNEKLPECMYRAT